MVFSLEKAWAVATGQKRSDRSCKGGEIQYPKGPSVGPSTLAALFYVLPTSLSKKKEPLSLFEITWARNLFFGNGCLSQAPKPVQNPQNYNRTLGWLATERPRQTRRGKQV